MTPGTWRDTIRWEVARAGASYEVTEFFNDVPMGSPRYFDNEEQVDAHIESARYNFKTAQIRSLRAMRNANRR
jgi:hypothetical protein